MIIIQYPYYLHKYYILIYIFIKILKYITEWVLDGWVLPNFLGFFFQIFSGLSLSSLQVWGFFVHPNQNVHSLKFLVPINFITSPPWVIHHHTAIEVARVFRRKLELFFLLMSLKRTFNPLSLANQPSHFVILSKYLLL